MKIAILPVIAVLIAIVSLAPQDAHATPYVATGGNWNSAASWGGSGPPIVINFGDTVTIPNGVTITNTGTISNNGGTITINSGGAIINTGTIINKIDLLLHVGTINNAGTITNNGAINNLKGKINNIGPSGMIINNGNINNLGTINNNGGKITNNNLIRNPTTAGGSGVINNVAGGTIDNTGGTINNPSTINNCATYTGSPPLFNGPIPISCPQIPEFPIPFSMVIIFAAVAAVYMGIRQKMLPGFKRF